jgi:hypothetical protein
MDAVNTFLNSTLKEEVYYRYLLGLSHYRLIILRLHKVVYGLRIAGKRWEDDIKEMLLLLRFKSCPNDPALYTNNRMVIIVFVDDFLATYHRSESTHA